MRGIDGTTIDHIKFTKGMRCLIPIVAINRSTEIWGPDAGEFNPDRHDDSTLPKKNVPGVYGSVLSFNGGARNCM